MCGIGSLIIGILRIYFLWFNMLFLHRLTKTQIADLPVPINVLSTISYIQTAVSAITIIVAVLLLLGTVKSKKKLLLPWICWVVFEEFLDVIIVMYYIIKTIKLRASVYIGDSVFLVINMYCVLCVFSFYKHLKQQDNKTPMYRFQIASDSEDDEILLPSSQVI
ncbi:hypothetical protein AC249_AIPGENE15453 [Exaiptasia diaphana]|nr:hypothetical protein AC249_AIPGENE15453 [Exaiptasia diaphana]